MSKKLKGNLMLLLTSLIWGSAFVAQVVGMDHIGPFTFNSVRNFVGSVFLLIVIPFLKNNAPHDPKEAPATENKNVLLKGGVFCGVMLFIASSLQQFGVLYTTAGKAGFITTLYVVIVPIIGLFLGKKVSKKIWFCVCLAAVGLYLLSIKGDLSVNLGDFLVFLCAIFFSFHILVIDYFSPQVDGVKMSCIQFFICGLLNTVAMFIFEAPSVSAIRMSIIPILYAGALSSGVGYTLQIVAQKDTDPTIASLILSLESVFAVIAGVLLLNESLTLRELSGCVLMFIAIVIAQLPEKAPLKEIQNG